ncbi:MAG: histidinol-phosphatase [Desulfobacterales bacterium]|nr:histidinol-phosphatase [Desulfobacterales bacterium]
MENKLVSIHGGHSGEFCSHAKNSLEEIIKTYIDKGFTWVGITEHIPPLSEKFLWPDEIKQGLNLKSAYERFERYIYTCRALQKKYASKIKIYVGFESETHTGSDDFVKKLINIFKPDYIVGSVHHVDDMIFDYSEEHYERAVKSFVGGIDELYCRYFDLQFSMINTLKPKVVGHFDLIRIYDTNYKERIKIPEINDKITRNLELIKKLGLILDFNMRALSKGSTEPYISMPILKKAIDMRITLIPGDDSHGIDSAGLNIYRGIEILTKFGINTKEFEF